MFAILNNKFEIKKDVHTAHASFSNAESDNRNRIRFPKCAKINKYIYTVFRV